MGKFIYILERSFSYVTNGVTREYTDKVWENWYFDNLEDAIFHVNTNYKMYNLEVVNIPNGNYQKCIKKWKYKNDLKDDILERLTNYISIYKIEIINFKRLAKE